MGAAVQSFDVVIPVDGGTNYTPPFLPGEMLAVQFNVSRSTATGGTLTATPQHSPDGGRNWVDKTALTLTSTGSFAQNAVTPLYGGDAGTTPHHALCRLKLSTSVSATVEVLVRARGRRQPRQRLLYDGVVPTTALYSAPFDLSPSTQRASLHAIGIPIGSNTSPTLTVQLEVTHDGNNWGNQTATAEINNRPLTANQETVNTASLDLSGARGLRARFRIVSGSGAATNVSHVRLYLTEWGRFDDADDMDDAELEEDDDCGTRRSPVRKPSRAPVRALLGPPGLLPSRRS